MLCSVLERSNYTIICLRVLEAPKYPVISLLYAAFFVNVVTREMMDKKAYNGLIGGVDLGSKAQG